MMPEFGEISQVAIVVKDMWKTVKSYHELFGWKPWNIYICKPPKHVDTYLHGKPVTYTMQIAETLVGSIGFEVIEPLEGPSIYKEFLQEKGEGLHHIACFKVTDYDKTVAAFAKKGVPVLMGGTIDGLRYCYVDAIPSLKVVLETGDAGSLKPDSTYP